MPAIKAMDGERMQTEGARCVAAPMAAAERAKRAAPPLPLASLLLHCEPSFAPPENNIASGCSLLPVPPCPRAADVLTIENSRSDDAMVAALAASGAACCTRRSFLEVCAEDPTFHPAPRPASGRPCSCQRMLQPSLHAAPAHPCDPFLKTETEPLLLLSTANAPSATPPPGFGADVGPGVYDVHSPVVPSVEWLADRIRAFLQARHPSCHNLRRNGPTAALRGSPPNCRGVAGGAGRCRGRCSRRRSRGLNQRLQPACAAARPAPVVGPQC
jgi:hypothetical protein